MITDLAQNAPQALAPADVVVVGGGIAGLILAVKLRTRGMSVVVLESGGPGNTSQPHALNEVVQRGRLYRGATDGRARGLGGTSALWGGALLPFLPEDLRARPGIDAAPWPVDFGAVAAYIGELERLFGLDHSPFDEDFIAAAGLKTAVPVGDPEFLARFAKWPAFRRRNVAALFGRQLDRDPGLTVLLNATVTAFDLDPARGRVTGVRAAHVGGHSVVAVGGKVVVCAGAIETTRLLLLLDRSTQGRAFAGCEALGRYFHDHVSTCAARIVAQQPRALNRLAGFRFAGGAMRSLRFELTPYAQRASGVGSAFGHISFRSEVASGFDHLRTLLRTLQRTRRVDADAAMKLVHDSPYLARMAYWRLVHRQLRWPEPARYELHVVAEQRPRADNRILLADDTDPFGLPRAAIDWRISAEDEATIRAFAQRFDAYWTRHRLDAIGTLDWGGGLDGGRAAQADAIGDVFHPGGTTRMGRDPRHAVVDADLRAFAVPNLWVASTSVFPTGASANPTMMLMLFTLRLADHLAGAP